MSLHNGQPVATTDAARVTGTQDAVPAGASEGPILSAHGLTVGYGRQAVVRELDLHVDPGEVVALLGPNGAGKTTTMLALSGELTPMGGEVRLNGHPTKAPLHRRARNGLSFVTEERSIFRGLTTQENLRAGRVGVDIALRYFPELEQRLGVKAGLLSGGEQQMLTLARALGRRPRVLLADELSLGLAPLVVKRLLEAVRAAADDGCGVVLVEQHVRQALRIADRAYILSHGRVEISGPASELLGQLGEIEEKYLSGPGGASSPLGVNQ